MLVECNNKIKEYNPDKQIGIRTLEKHLKKLKEVSNWPIKKYKPTRIELVQKKYPGTIINYPHKDNVDTTRVKFITLYENKKIPDTLSPEEHAKIQEAFTILDKYSGSEGFQWLEEFIDEGRNSFHIELLLKQKISYEENLTGMHKWFSNIKSAIADKIVLSVKREVLRGSKKVEKNVIFNPHFLKLFKNKWYAFGKELNNPDNKVYVLPIDKYILDIKYDKKRKYIETKINYPGEPYETYFFKDIIGVTNDQNKKPIEVILRFYDKQKFRLIDSKKPHHSWKKIEEKNNFIDVSLKVKINNELINFILENLSSLQVISPILLKKTIIKELKKGLKYNTNL